MLGDTSSAENIYIACGHTDMRKAIDGLATIVEENFRINPYKNSLFLFCGRRRDRIKALYWEGDGFLLLYKRLETGSFQWPNDPDDVKTITKQELRWLLEGLSINQPKAVKKLKINPK
jgi:transposase